MSKMSYDETDYTKDCKYFDEAKIIDSYYIDDPCHEDSYYYYDDEDSCCGEKSDCYSEYQYFYDCGCICYLIQDTFLDFEDEYEIYRCDGCKYRKDE